MAERTAEEIAESLAADDFDNVVRCALEQGLGSPDRVTISGMSAGGMFSVLALDDDLNELMSPEDYERLRALGLVTGEHLNLDGHAVADVLNRLAKDG